MVKKLAISFKANNVGSPNLAQGLIAKLDQAKGDKTRVDAARKLLKPELANRLLPLIEALDSDDSDAVVKIMEKLNEAIAEIKTEVREDWIEGTNYSNQTDQSA